MSGTMLRQNAQFHDQLDVMVGHWRAEDVSDSAGPGMEEPRALAAAGESGDGGTEEIHEWMPDGFFLLHRWDVTVGENAFKGTEIVDYRPARGDFFTRLFERSDDRRERTTPVDGTILTFKEPSARATIALTDEGTSLAIAWEWGEDGSDWVPLCDLVSQTGH